MPFDPNSAKKARKSKRGPAKKLELIQIKTVK